MQADERERRVEEAHAKLAELIRRYDERDAQNGVQRKKITTPDEARAWLAEKFGEPSYTQEEIDRQLGEFIKKFGGRRDDTDSQNEAGEA